MSRLSPRSLVVVVAVVVVGLLSGGIYALVSGGGRETKITANFLTTPGLYVGNAVRILGMPVGQITKITARGTYVTVQMEIPASQKVPADATAEIMAPNVVNDRFVQLDPPYTGGPTMPNGGLIPGSRPQRRQRPRRAPRSHRRRGPGVRQQRGRAQLHYHQPR